jgi:hypothetical protein
LPPTASHENYRFSEALHNLVQEMAGALRLAFLGREVTLAARGTKR